MRIKCVVLFWDEAGGGGESTNINIINFQHRHIIITQQHLWVKIIFPSSSTNMRTFARCRIINLRIFLHTYKEGEKMKCFQCFCVDRNNRLATLKVIVVNYKNQGNEPQTTTH